MGINISRKSDNCIASGKVCGRVPDLTSTLNTHTTHTHTHTPHTHTHAHTQTHTHMTHMHTCVGKSILTTYQHTTQLHAELISTSSTTTPHHLLAQLHAKTHMHQILRAHRLQAWPAFAHQLCIKGIHLSMFRVHACLRLRILNILQGACVFALTHPPGHFQGARVCVYAST